MSSGGSSTSGSSPVRETIQFSSDSGSDQDALSEEKGRKEDLLSVQSSQLSKGGEVREEGAVMVEEEDGNLGTRDQLKIVSEILRMGPFVFRIIF